ncbi:xanthine dehydrogenase family protein molybdopterin-binding subunit [Methylobacterium organophilum]|uniref:xanthine dehydrogenase family protein molybdopterin-binding subunit n=1 Tax=Methylobacterium organophilum TaxID=410 RepID=UPI001F1444D9|nr:xanthine dehydrogenase family protein molybdopterin-binding subunit [Methylobacterium organophilum]UMY16034.1 xanthine dehydrogenase family protein molybdopterin-binding subunit [Methylobacterium organophilum]
MAASRLVGTPVPRKEDRRLLLGQARFVADIALPRMLHMAVVRSDHAHALIKGIDITAAASAAGVRLVLTGADLSDSVGPLPSIDLAGEGNAALQRVLATDRVRFVGEPVAVVVAEDPFMAADAAALIEIAYQPLPVVLDAEAAASATPPALLYERLGCNVIHTCRQEVGDPDAAFAAADRVFEKTFRIHRYVAAPMETRGVLADPTGQGERITLYSSTQFPHLLRGFLAGVLGLPEADLRVVAPDVGGGFGVKCEFYPEEILAVVAARRLGRPVRWIESRAEHFVATTHAREQVHRVRAALDADGIVTAMTLHSLTDNGAAAATLSVTPASISSAMLRGPYRVPNYRAESHSVVTNKTPLAVYRGAGHPQATLCMELMLDHIARDTGLDRVDLRRRNMITPAELPLDRGTAIVLAGKVVYDSGDYPASLDQALTLGLWESRGARAEAARARGRLHGVGLACFVEETAIGPYETGNVRVDGSGKVTVLTGASPHGQGTATALAQLVAEELEIDIDRVVVRHGDTDLLPDGVGTFASRGGAIAGAAARLAARKVREKALHVAAEMLQAKPEDLTWAEGEARAPNGASASLAAIAGRATAWNAMPDGLTSFNLAGEAHHQVTGIAFANATHLCEVEIDPRTGELAVTTYAVIHDCGTVINPMIVEGQVIGGLAQGLGGTLFEEIRYDAQGRPLAQSFADYLLPTAADMPRVIRTGSMESPSPLNPFGMKGAGEGGTTGSVAAITGAVADALAPLGVVIEGDGPFTPPTLLRLIREAAASAKDAIKDNAA